MTLFNATDAVAGDVMCALTKAGSLLEIIQTEEGATGRIATILSLQHKSRFTAQMIVLGPMPKPLRRERAKRGSSHGRLFFYEKILLHLY